MFQSKVYLRKYGMILDGTKIVELKLLGRKVKNSKYNYRGFATKFAQISGGKPINTVFDAVQSPLCLVPLWNWKNLGLWKNFQQKNLCKKLCLELTVN